MYDTPIYVQISNFIEDQIIDDKLQVEDQVPSTNEIARLFDINPATAGKGMNVLVEQNILYKKRGIGMFVTAEAKTIIIEKRKTDFIETRIPELTKEAKRLNITSADLEKLIRREYND